MGAALYIVLDQEIAGFDPFINGKSLSVAERKLGRLAEKLGVTPLMEFFSVSAEEAMDFQDGLEIGAADKVMPPPEQWFTPEQGLQSVDAMIEAITQDPGVVKDAQAVLQDLAEWQSVLRCAKSEGVRWHAAIDY